MVRPALALGVMLASAGVALADPATPPEHHERDYRAIGPGVYVARDDAPSVDYPSSNLIVRIYTRAALSAGPGFSFDTSLLQGVPPYHYTIDGGRLGALHDTDITIDCANRTYEVVDTQRLLPKGIWRAASTLPVLKAVFTYACTEAHAHP